MVAYKNASTELKAGFANDSIMKILLPLDMVFVFGALALKLLQLLFNFGSGFGGLIPTIAFWGFLFGLVLAFANYNLFYLYAGMFGYAAIQLIYFFKYLFMKFGGFYFSYLIPALLFGFLGYLVFKAASTGGANQANQ